MIPIWVKLPNLPLNCWGSDSLSRIFCWVCRCMQMSALLLRLEFHLLGCSSKWMLLSLFLSVFGLRTGKGMCSSKRYDWTPPFCQDCQMVGHSCEKWVPAPTRCCC